MAATPIFQLFKKSGCYHVQIFADLVLRPSMVSKLRECFGGRRRKLPFYFGAAYEGDGKQVIGLSARLERVKADRYALWIGLFPSITGPPPSFGKFSDLVERIGKHIGDREAQATVSFSFQRNAVESVFQPFTVTDRPTIFDEIIGVTGTKKDAHGKLLYQMEISVGEKQIQHTIRFRQTLRLADDAPVALIETAGKISNLALTPKDVK